MEMHVVILATAEFGLKINQIILFSQYSMKVKVHIARRFSVTGVAKA